VKEVTGIQSLILLVPEPAGSTSSTSTGTEMVAENADLPELPEVCRAYSQNHIPVQNSDGININ
jgi:hypothetical protein